MSLTRMFDLVCLRFFADITPPIWVDQGMIWLTFWFPLVLVSISIGLLFPKRWRFFGQASLLAGLFSVTLVELLWKPLFHRARPYATLEWVRLLVEPSNSYSLPSGHTSFAFSIAFALSVLPSKFWPAVTMFLALMTAISRVYVGIHYPTDVVLAMFHGALCTLLAYLLLTKSKKLVAKN
jgi:undecaprenyl-diphosphatase